MSHSFDDELTFAAEDSAAQEHQSTPWKILIADAEGEPGDSTTAQRDAFHARSLSDPREQRDPVVVTPRPYGAFRLVIVLLDPGRVHVAVRGRERV